MCLRCLQPILLTAFDQLRATIPAKSDPLMLDYSTLMSRTKWADSQLVTSKVRVAKPLLAHLPSKGFTLSHECTYSCVRRMVLGHADMVKDTQEEEAVAIFKRSETAAPVTCVQANDEYCTTMSKQQAVQQCVHSSGAAGCSALHSTGCGTAARVVAAAIYQPTFKNVADVQPCTSVSQMSLKRSWNYSYELFLKNEAACTHALQKFLEVHHTPRSGLVVMVLKPEEDNIIILVVTVEGFEASEPAFKGSGHG